MCASISPRTASIFRRMTCATSASATRPSPAALPRRSFALCCHHEVDFARSLFEQGLPLIGRVNRDLALDLDLFSRGGLEILRAIERRNYDVLSARPAISKLTKLALALRALAAKCCRFCASARRSTGKTCLTPNSPSTTSPWPAPMRPAAGSPSAKPKTSTTPSSRSLADRRNAICAIYAFMRQADDLADDEIHPARRAPAPSGRMARCLARVPRRARRPSIPSFSPCATRPALQHSARAARRARQPVSLIDLDHAADGAPETYATFADLYRYCYLVASVVGLVCIRIFGYQDLRAEKLAEETGIAFQLTNILRDVAEDAARNRVYLPLKNLGATRRFARCNPASPRPARRPHPPSASCSLPSRAAPNSYYSSLALSASLDRPRQPSRSLGSGFHLSRVVEAHRARRLRRLHAPRHCAPLAESSPSSLWAWCGWLGRASSARTLYRGVLIGFERPAGRRACILSGARGA